MSGSETDLVFVYGTLRKGASNHWRMDQAEFVGNGAVAGALYRIDWYPGLVLGPVGGTVAGELYRVPPELLEELDAFEGNEYARVLAEVHGEDGGCRERAWVWDYRGPVDERRRIPGNDWLEGFGS